MSKLKHIFEAKNKQSETKQNTEKSKTKQNLKILLNSTISSWMQCFGLNINFNCLWCIHLYMSIWPVAVMTSLTLHQHSISVLLLVLLECIHFFIYVVAIFFIIEFSSFMIFIDLRSLIIWKRSRWCCGLRAGLRLSGRSWVPITVG